ncbi:Tfp pilus assembly protein PilF [Anseongella ginsenosidimutans]|uniref:Tfp pilus assembly protein PilF n=1 Tax=Anseongella ginsenosidimutans TaxID=496056 RepID=A0A4V2UTF4_9SPHI|nr:DUF5107 domain-containing protein [Anseongella ginsenosidimutans]TCS85835.1 Tfp pilus assembly protein PilF [Anseongella ginsenosidimutans]
MNEAVRIWEEQVLIPTYGTGEPEKNPMFLEKRVYQGSSGVVYPHPVIEKIKDEREDREYTGVFLENEYLKIMILPELGGRIQMAYDKVRERHFVYYNQVIKPALVGLTGPWISGGIEFNWPQHHRPSTFLPVDHTLAENKDGSKTVWLNEIEIMFRTRGMAGFTLYPGKAYLEISGRLYNRTHFPQTFLWWANPAVKVNEHYQSVFPPDVHAVFDHGKRDVSSFPIAKGTYYKVNYAPGTDISRYSTIPVPTSYMAIRSRYDFMGGYENDTQAGILHVANHHISPGKKQWTWGNGDFGRAWDRNLTDEDGPYIELMTGVFTDNQPDFSWLQPNEEKTFSQYFLPYSKAGMVKNATKEALVNLEEENGRLRIRVYVTAAYPGALIRLFQQKQEVFSTRFDLSPAQDFDQQIALPPEFSVKKLSGEDHSVSVKVSGEDEMATDNGSEFSAAALEEKPVGMLFLGSLRIEVRDAGNNLLVAWQPESEGEKEIPPPATAAPLPEALATNEELYLNGLHLEQYRHATFDPTDYYREALKRDPGDARNNNALGLWYLRRGKFAAAAPYFSNAVSRVTLRNPNPYDGEPYFNLGCSLKFQSKYQEACDAFYKASWNAAWQDSAFFELARIDCMQGQYQEALRLIDLALSRNIHNPQMRHLKAALLRKAGRRETAKDWLDETLSGDPFNYGCRFERYLLLLELGKPEEAERELGQMKTLMRNQSTTYIEYSLDYVHAGLYREAGSLLLQQAEGALPDPMVCYYLGWYAVKAQEEEAAKKHFLSASRCPAGYSFPNRVEDILALQSALQFNPDDAKACYYLGNLWYDKRQYREAISCWEKSAEIDAGFPTVHRNLSLAYHNKQKDKKKALASLERAFALNPKDARVLMELDQLYKLDNQPLQKRLGLLEQHPEEVRQRDDLYLEKVTLLNQSGKFEEARQQLAARRFHPWEGGEGKVVGQYLICHIELAKQALTENDPGRALALLSATEKYPENLGEGKLYNTPENDIYFLRGLAHEKAGRPEEAALNYRLATKGSSEPVQAIFYNDPQPDKILYQGLAWHKLGEPEKAKKVFEGLLAFGTAHMNDHIRIDYFAVSLPDLLVFDQDLDLRNRVHCHYMMGLGYLGLNEEVKCREMLEKTLEMNKYHQGAAVHLKMSGFLTESAPVFKEKNN